LLSQLFDISKYLSFILNQAVFTLDAPSKWKVNSYW